MGRLIDVDILFAVLLEERQRQYEMSCTEAERAAKFDAISDCLGIVNHMPEYSDKTSRIELTVSDVIHRFLTTSCQKVIMKRADDGREYTKIKDAFDEKNDWQVIGIIPRIKANGTRAVVELVLWCKDRNADIKELHDDLVSKTVDDLFC